MSSPSVFNRAPILRDEKHQLNDVIVGESYHQRKNHSRKRRPVDPPEEGNNNLLAPGVHEYDDAVNYNSNIKRLRASTSPDDLFDALSLKPPDPPAHSFCKKRKKEHDDDNDSIGNSSQHGGGGRRCTKSPKLQEDNEKGGETTSSALTSIAGDETEQQLKSSSSSSTKPDPPSDIHVASTTTEQETSEMEHDMSIDDNSSSNSNSDISISEGSLQRAMYQAVFGRRSSSAQYQFHSIPSTISSSCNNSSSSNNGIGCPYNDAVDSKIEDLIRRSRLEAEIQGRKEEEKQTTKGDDRRIDPNGDIEEDDMDTDGD